MPRTKRLRERWHNQGPIVVLTGAGASAALGLPTMASFPQLVEKAGQPLTWFAERMKWQKQDLDAEGIYERLELYAELGEKAQTDLVLEKLFDSSSMRPENLAEDATRALAQFQGLMLKHWGVLAVTPHEDIARYNQFLLTLRGMNNAPLKVFTTNYDLTFEALPSFRANQWDVVTGLVQEPDSLTMTLDLNQYLMAPNRANILAYRLHGCSHWFQEEEFGAITYEPNPSIVREVLRPMVVFPARGKAEALHDEVFAFAYRELRRALAEAVVCLVVGYSFRDAGIRAALAEAKWDMRFVVVDPAEMDLDEAPGLVYQEHIQGEFGDEAVNSAAIKACATALEEAKARRSAAKSDRAP